MLEHADRQTFLEEIWDPQPGDGVLFSEPTQQGKTHLAFQLLNKTPHVRPPVALVMKPRDPTPAWWTRELGWKEVQSWPPGPSLLARPPGYTLWPKHEMSLDPESLKRTNANLRAQFQRALLDTYKSGDRVIFCDEVYGLLELDLQEELTALWTRGAGMGAGLWCATQKASGTSTTSIPGHAFNSPMHLFLGKDPDKRARDRASEIGGVDPAFVADVIMRLPIHRIQTPQGFKPVSDKLYIGKAGPFMCTVGP